VKAIVAVAAQIAKRAPIRRKAMQTRQWKLERFATRRKILPTSELTRSDPISKESSDPSISKEPTH
jgi:hypothetical protein